MSAHEVVTLGGCGDMERFDQRDMASITAPDFPGERLVVCCNPDLAVERSRKLQKSCMI
jgi:hypothetical protein